MKTVNYTRKVRDNIFFYHDYDEIKKDHNGPIYYHKFGEYTCEYIWTNFKFIINPKSTIYDLTYNEFHKLLSNNFYKLDRHYGSYDEYDFLVDKLLKENYTIIPVYWSIYVQLDEPTTFNIDGEKLVPYPIEHKFSIKSLLDKLIPYPIEPKFLLSFYYIK